MDYYQVLRVPPNASKKDIEEAYQRLMKESRYDTSIDRRLIESAYRILGNESAKNQYDSQQSLRTKRATRGQKLRKPVGIIEWIKRRTIPQLLTALAITLVIAIAFYSMRFGYLLKEFQAGDILYESATDQKFGKVLRVEPAHPFGNTHIDAYQVELDPRVKTLGTSERVVWLPQESVKARCYKKNTR